MNKQKVLFIDTHNADCSQILQGLLEKIYGDRYDAYSAGITPERVSIHVVKVMSEIGVELLTYRSKSVDEFRDMQFDYIVSMGEKAKNACRYLTNGREHLHINFEVCLNQATEKSLIMHNLRNVRDQLQAWLMVTFEKKQ